MPDRITVPRASLAVTILDDMDYMTLCQTPEGQRAFALFCALLAAAKNLDNGGRFSAPLPVLAMTVRWSAPDFKCALECLLESTGRWVVGTLESFTLRSFVKWNKGWGGARKGSGRKPQQHEPTIKLNQVAKLGSTSASVTVKDKDSLGADKPRRQRKATFADLWLPELRQLLSYTASDADLCKAINRLKAVAGEDAFKALVHDLTARGWQAESPGHLWAYMGDALRKRMPATATAHNGVSETFRRPRREQAGSNGDTGSAPRGDGGLGARVEREAGRAGVVGQGHGSAADGRDGGGEDDASAHDL